MRRQTRIWKLRPRALRRRLLNLRLRAKGLLHIRIVYNLREGCHLIARTSADPIGTFGAQPAGFGGAMLHDWGQAAGPVLFEPSGAPRPCQDGPRSLRPYSWPRGQIGG